MIQSIVTQLKNLC